MKVCTVIVAKPIQSRSDQTDDHTKNISFMMDKKGNWKLSPAYDVTYAFHPTNFWLAQHQLSINGKRKDITQKEMLTLANEISIKKGKTIIAEIADTVNNWPEFAKAADIPLKQMNSIKKLHLTGITST